MKTELLAKILQFNSSEFSRRYLEFVAVSGSSEAVSTLLFFTLDNRSMS